MSNQFDMENEIIFHGLAAAREKRFGVPNRELSNGDLADKYFDIAEHLRKQGKYKEAAKFERLARDARDGFRAHLDS